MYFFVLECLIGKFGLDCVYNCSGYCMGDIRCNRIIGRCDIGCKVGYIGELCDVGLIICRYD